MSAATLEHELTALLSRDASASDTPDFVLARFMLDCLAAYQAASARRAEWQSAPRETSPTLDDLRLSGTVSARVMNALANLGIDTIDQLCATKPSTLRKAKHLGPQSIQEIVLALSRLGRSLAPEHS